MYFIFYAPPVEAAANSAAIQLVLVSGGELFAFLGVSKNIRINRIFSNHFPTLLARARFGIHEF